MLGKRAGYVNVRITAGRTVRTSGARARALPAMVRAMRAVVVALMIIPASARLVVNSTLVEGVSAPLAIDIDFAPAPTFAWRTYGGAQSAYRVRVATDASFSAAATLWSSGAVTSAASAAAYGGAPLPHGADLFLSVEAADAAGAWSAPAVAPFGTGLDSAAWAADAAARGSWLGACTAGAAAPALRLSFALSPARVTRARAYASSVGVYTLAVNGARAGGGRDAVLTPGWATVPTSRVAADAYDVTAALAAGGENVVGMTLGQGKYGYNGEFCAAADASCYAGVVAIVIEQEGGNVTRVDSTSGWPWACAPSATTYNSLFGGETLDARLAQPGWDAPGFDARAWAPAPRRNSTVTVISAGPPAMRVIADVAPVSVAPHGSGVPVVAGGAFLIASPSPNVWWVQGWPSAPVLRFFVAECTPCAGVDACGALVPVAPAVLAAIAVAPSNFSCSQLPTSNVTAFQFDFGANMAGFCTLTLPPLAPNASLSLVHGEILNDAGAVDNTFGSSDGIRRCSVPGINCADQTDTFIAGATPMSTFTPQMTFHGFRHVALFGWPAGAPAPTLATLTCHVVHSAMADAGGAAFPNSATLTLLQAAVVRTQRSNLFSIPSDCPTREKRGWGGDAHVTVDSALLNLAAAPLYAHWTRTFAELQEMSCVPAASGAAAAAVAAGGLPQPVAPADYVCCPPGRFGCNAQTPKNATGFLPDVLPFDSISGWPGDWVWQTVAVAVPHALLLSTGDVNALARVFPMVDALLAAADGAVDARGLLTLGAYGDWLAAEPTSMLFAQNFYFARAAELAAELAGALGRAADAAALTALSAAVSARMVGALFDAASGTWDGAPLNMNPQAMALAVGLGGAATANASALTGAALAAAVARNGGHATGGVASTRWTFAGLDVAGRADLALHVATQPVPPSFAFMVIDPDMPQTVWESWKGSATSSDGSKNQCVLTRTSAAPAR